MRAVSANALDDFLEQTQDAAFVLDPVGDRIVEANAAGRALLGLSREDVLASTISQIHPGELSQLREFVGEALRDGHGTTTTLTCRIASGPCVPAEIALYAFAGDERVHLLALVRDRSEHRSREHGD